MTVHQTPSEALTEAIRRAIGTSSLTGIGTAGQFVKCISFRDYMAMCLYHPEYGYYRSGENRVGRDGDFYTSAYIGDIMGEQLAERVEGLASEHFPKEEQIEVLDWGGGAGRLSRQMLDAWSGLGAAGARFRLTLIDGDPEHRRQAAAHLSEHMDAGRARVLSVEQADAENWRDRQVIVVANELLDAFPVHRVVQTGGKLWEWGVSWDDVQNRFVPCRMTPTAPLLQQWLSNQGVRLAEGQTTEIGLQAGEWTASLASKLGRAILILIDYGDSTAELTGSHRMDGTLLCYEGHRAHNDPYRNPGAQDLTAHVDFDLIRRFAVEAGWRELEYGTQKRFLVDSGVLAKLAAHQIADPFHPVVRRNRAIRQLVLSDGMSELFKVQMWLK